MDIIRVGLIARLSFWNNGNCIKDDEDLVESSVYVFERNYIVDLNERILSENK